MTHNPHDLVDLACSEAGQGPPLILLHGLGSSQNDWLMQQVALVPRYRTLVVDLRGHGKSPKPPGPYHMPLLAADVARLLTRRGAHPAHVIGLSLGGAVAQQLALDWPHLVRSLMLVNTAARFMSGGWRQRLMGLRRMIGVYLGDMDSVAQAVAERLFPRPEQAAWRRETAQRMAANDLKAYRAVLWAIARFDLRQRLGEIRCPTLVVAGDEDTTVPMAAKRLLAERIPGSRLEIIDHSGHATPIDQPEAFNRVMLRFLEMMPEP
ncbi:MAG: alpha/beta fold hydrolase [Anaerolinea sp.]|nr:alpha/beta fold hydrolase [Anaerolinea sp.]